MKRLTGISDMGIRQRVMILALLPTLIMALTLAGYMISSRLNSERENLFHNGQTLLQYLAGAAEFGLFSDNAEALSSLAKVPLKRSEVTDVIFVNAQGSIIYRSGDIEVPIPPLSIPKPDNQATSATPLNNLWMLQAPVLLAGGAIEDFPQQQSPPEPEPIGQVLLLINETQLKQTQQTILMQGIFITLLGLVLTVWLALAIGRSITRPIQGIIRTIDRLRHEQLEARIEVSNRGEIGELEKGINNLAERVQATQAQLQEQVDQATHHLRLTLERLEQKNEDLELARSRAEQANQAKDLFLARMSHELRTPLTSVIGFIRLLKKTALNGEQREYSDIISRTSTLLLSLIDDILDFSKLRSDAIQVEQIPFNLEQNIEETLAMQGPSAAEQGISLYLVVQPGLPEQVLGDPTRIRQIIGNLVGNAVKFTDQGHVCLYLNYRHDHHNRVQVTLTIEDTGIGIEPDKLDELFQPFAQADTSISRRFGGSGLGLVITKHLVELMSGQIHISSRVRQGTRIRVELPFYHLSQAESEQPLRNRNLLLFSRSPQGQAEIHNCLLQWGANTSKAGDQRQLRAYLKAAHKLDTLIIDLDQGTRPYYLRQLLKAVRNLYQGELILILPGEFSQDINDLLPTDHPTRLLSRPLNRHKLLAKLIQQQPLRSPLHQEPLLSSRHASLEGLKLLVAEDNQFNRLLLQKILEQAGARPVMVENGDQALALARQQTFDCILMDIHMPGMDGIEASNEIHALPEPLNQAPILALTANIIANEEQALKAAGVEMILNKPINEKQVIEQIRQVTKRPTTAAAGTTEKTRLSDYGISKQAFYQELHQQLQSLHQAFINKEIEQLRDHSHQLLGLAGLLDLVELEAATLAFNRAVKTASWRQIWSYLWRLHRVIHGVQA